MGEETDFNFELLNKVYIILNWGVGSIIVEQSFVQGEKPTWFSLFSLNQVILVVILLTASQIRRSCLFQDPDLPKV